MTSFDCQFYQIYLVTRGKIKKMKIFPLGKDSFSYHTPIFLPLSSTFPNSRKFCINRDLFPICIFFIDVKKLEEQLFIRHDVSPNLVCDKSM